MKDNLALQADQKIDRQQIFGRHIASTLGLQPDKNDRYHTDYGLKTAFGLVDLITQLKREADQYITTGIR